jgi:hypothetical protein
MSAGVLQLSNNDLIVLRDVASQYYLQAGQDSDPMTAVAKLISGNIGGLLQPSLYFQVHTTPIQGFWTITTIATGKFLKVDTSSTGNHNKLSWVDTNPSSDFVMDKSPFYFSFTQVPGFDAPVLYVLGTYYNGGMTLQQPDGAGSDAVFLPPQAIPGTAPEISFEVTVPNEPPNNLGKIAMNALDLNSPPAGGASIGRMGMMAGSSSSSSSGGTAVDGWAVAFIILIAVLALIALGYGIYMLYKYYTRGEIKKRRMIVTSAPTTVTSDAPPPFEASSDATPSSTTITTTPSTAVTPGTTTVSTTAPTPPGTAPATPTLGGYYNPTNHFYGRHQRFGGTAPVLSMPASVVNSPQLQAHSGHGSFGVF